MPRLPVAGVAIPRFSLIMINQAGADLIAEALIGRLTSDLEQPASRLHKAVSGIFDGIMEQAATSDGAMWRVRVCVCVCVCVYMLVYVCACV